MSYTPTVDSTDRYATVDITGERFTYPVSTATIAGVAAPIAGNNLLKASNNFSDSSWTKTRASVGATTSVTLTSGESVTMTKIVEDGTAANTHRVAQASLTNRGDLPIVARLLVKQSDAARNGVQLVMYGDSYASFITAVFNVEAGSVTSSSASGAGVVAGTSITAMGDGAYLCILRGTVSVTANSVLNEYEVRITNDSNTSTYSGDSTSGVYIAQAQLTEGTEATTYQETSSQALASADDLTSSSWSVSNILTRTGGQTDYLGGTRATLIIPSTASAQHQINQALVAADYVDNSTVKMSVALKANGYTWARIHVGNKTPSYPGSYFNLSDGTLGTNAGSLSRSIESLGNGWYLCTVTGSIGSGASTPSATIHVASADNTLSFVGDGTSGLLVSHPLMHAADITQEWSAYQRPRISGDGQRLTHSGDLSNAAHTKTRTTISGSTHNATLDTGEVLVMQKIVEDGTAASTHLLTLPADTLASGTVYVYQVKLKAAGRTHAAIQIGTGSEAYGATVPFVYVNLTTGATSALAGGSVTTEDLGDGVWKVNFTAIATTSSASTAMRIKLADATPSDSYSGNSTDGVYASEPIFVAGSTAPSYTRSYADRLASGGSTTGRAYVQIPHIDDFDAAGIHIGTRWNTEQEWILTDGTDTATSTEQIAPPDADAFDSVGVGPYEHAPDGVTPGDDGYMHLLTGAGTFTTSAFGFAPTENSTFRSMAYSVVDAEWLAGLDTSEDFSTPPSPPDESLWVAVKYIVTNVVQEIT